jgi:hypothetical protein
MADAGANVGVAARRSGLERYAHTHHTVHDSAGMNAWSILVAASFATVVACDGRIAPQQQTPTDAAPDAACLGTDVADASSGLQCKPLFRTVSDALASEELPRAYVSMPWVMNMERPSARVLAAPRQTRRQRSVWGTSFSSATSADCICDDRMNEGVFAHETMTPSVRRLRGARGPKRGGYLVPRDPRARTGVAEGAGFVRLE